MPCTTYPVGTHVVSTTWYHKDVDNCISGAGPNETHLVVDKAAGDGITGYIVLAENATVELSDVSFSNPECTPYGIFAWGGSTLACTRVHFKAGSTISGDQAGCSVRFENCEFDTNCSVRFHGPTCNVQLIDCQGEHNLSILGSTRLCGLDGTPMAVEQAVEKQFRQYLDRHKIPGGQLAVVHDNAVALNLAVGWQDVDTQEPMMQHDRIGLHCTWKPVIGVAVQLLVSDGRLSLDWNPMSMLGVDLKDAVVHPWWRQLTLEHCLRHTAGFGFGTEDLRFKPGQSCDAIDGKSFAMLPSKADLAAPPGTVHNYSTSSMSLVAIVIEKLLGGKWEDFCGWDYRPGPERASGRFIIERILLPTQSILPNPALYWEGGRKATCYARTDGSADAASGTIFPSGTHTVSTKWCHEGVGNCISGAGPRETHLVVDKSAGDGITGYIVLAENATVELSDMSFSNPELTPYGIFAHGNSTLVCKRVHFQEGSIIYGPDAGCLMCFESCEFDPGSTLTFDAADCNIHLLGCKGQDNLLVHGSAKLQVEGRHDHLLKRSTPKSLRHDIRKSGEGTSYGASGIYEAPMLCMAAFGAGLSKILEKQRIDELVTNGKVGQGLGWNVSPSGSGHGGGGADEQITLLLRAADGRTVVAAGVTAQPDAPCMDGLHKVVNNALAVWSS